MVIMFIVLCAIVLYHCVTTVEFDSYDVLHIYTFNFQLRKLSRTKIKLDEAISQFYLDLTYKCNLRLIYILSFVIRFTHKIVVLKQNSFYIKKTSIKLICIIYITKLFTWIYIDFILSSYMLALTLYWKSLKLIVT